MRTLARAPSVMGAMTIPLGQRAHPQRLTINSPSKHSHMMGTMVEWCHTCSGMISCPRTDTCQHPGVTTAGVYSVSSVRQHAARHIPWRAAPWHAQREVMCRRTHSILRGRISTPTRTDAPAAAWDLRVEEDGASSSQHSASTCRASTHRVLERRGSHSCLAVGRRNHGSPRGETPGTSESSCPETAATHMPVMIAWRAAVWQRQR